MIVTSDMTKDIQLCLAYLKVMNQIRRVHRRRKSEKEDCIHLSKQLYAWKVDETFVIQIEENSANEKKQSYSKEN